MSRHRYHEDIALSDEEFRSATHDDVSWSCIEHAPTNADENRDPFDDFPRQQGEFVPTPYPRTAATGSSSGYYAALRRNAELLDGEDQDGTEDENHAIAGNTEFFEAYDHSEFADIEPTEYSGNTAVSPARYDRPGYDVERAREHEREYPNDPFSDRTVGRQSGRWRLRRKEKPAEDLASADAPTDAFDLDDLESAKRKNKSGGVHRRRSNSVGARGRIAISALAAGAFVAADLGQYLSGETTSVSLSSSTETDSAALTAVSPVADTVDLSDEASAIRTEEHATAVTDVHPAVATEPAAADAQATSVRRAVEYTRPQFVTPAHGALFVGFGSQWGSFHYGIDIVNELGTTVVAAADGVIVESGPMEGLGYWTRQELSDGTSLVYGHLNESFTQAGQHVVAGEHLGGMGTRGATNVGHLYLEVWDSHSRKIYPRSWLAARGVAL